MIPIERAARALWEISGQPYHASDLSPSILPPEAKPDWERFVPHIRTVLTAMREPSEAMEKAVDELAEESGAQYDIGPDVIWRKMIDAALSEELQ
ncbi:hypothetical protein BH10PSE12_BH10PSE12_02520 [soil metagenome]